MLQTTESKQNTNFFQRENCALFDSARVNIPLKTHSVKQRTSQVPIVIVSNN